MHTAATTDPVIERVRRALGRTGPLAAPPVPPRIDEPVARLVHSTIGLPDLFMKRAADLKMLVEPVRVDDLLPRMAAFLRERQCRRVMLSDTPTLTGLDAAARLASEGFDARRWAEMTAD